MIKLIESKHKIEIDSKTALEISDAIFRYLEHEIKTYRNLEDEERCFFDNNNSFLEYMYDLGGIAGNPENINEKRSDFFLNYFKRT